MKSDLDYVLELAELLDGDERRFREALILECDMKEGSASLDEAMAAFRELRRTKARLRAGR